MRNEYLYSDTQVAELARKYAAGLEQTAGVRESYLRILLAHSRAKIDEKRLTVPRALKMIGEVHEHLYKVILDAITTPDIAAAEGISQEEATRRSLERNRRSNFARTAKYALDVFVRTGGKLKDLPADVTKEMLRRQGVSSNRGSVETVQRSAHRAVARLGKLAELLASLDRKAAAELVDEVMQIIGPFAKPLTKRAIRKGQITLHPENQAHH